MFELYQIRYFLAVVETGTFTRAARRMGVTQPTLSAGIGKLEAGLDARLFERSGRRTFLTTAGSQFVDRASAIIEACNRAETELREVRSPEVLRLGVLVTVPARWVQRLARDFRSAWRGAVLELFEGTEQEIANRLDAGPLDVALTVARPDRSEQIELHREPLTLAVSRDHRLAGRRSVGPADLVDEGVIVRTRCEFLSETSRFFTDHNLRPRIVYRSAEDERALAMVGAGLGITVMPDGYRAPDVARPAIDGFDYTRTLALVRAPRERSPGRALLVERFEQLARSQAWTGTE